MPRNTPIPEGVYNLRVDKVVLGKSGKASKNPGAQMLTVHLAVFGPEQAEEYHGRKIFENLMLEGDGAFRTREFLEACGKDEDYQLEDTDELIGLELSAAVAEEEERKDPVSGISIQARNRVRRFLLLEG